MRKKNFLLIMADQMRADALSSGAGTPTLDMLSSKGIKYTNAFTTCPICAPARASLLLGKYPSRLGLEDNSPHCIPSDIPNWVKILKDNGYKTSLFGKSHYYAYNGTYPDMREMEPYMRMLGYDVVNEVPGPRVCGSIKSHMTELWKEEGLIDAYRTDMRSRYGTNQAVSKPTILPFELYPDVYVPRQAIRYFENITESGPFFSFISFTGPHDPWDCPKKYMDRYPDPVINPPLGRITDLAAERDKGLWDIPLEYDGVEEAQAVEIRRDYAAHVRLIDDMIGEIMEVLEKKRLLEDTVIIFTSDHGEMNGDYGRLYKMNFMNSSVRIPLIVSHPSMNLGMTDDRLVELHDIGPTILDIAGVKAEGYGELDGHSLFQEENRKYVISEYRHETMVFDGRWKLIANSSDKPYLLFDTLTDQNEQYNLVNTNRVEEKHLINIITAHRRKNHG